MSEIQTDTPNINAEPPKNVIEKYGNQFISPTNLQFLSQSFDTYSETTEKRGKMAKVLGTASTVVAITTVGIAFAPITATLGATIGLCMFWTTWCKNNSRLKELEYIGGVCAGYCRSLLEQMNEMSKFYTILDKVKVKSVITVEDLTLIEEEIKHFSEHPLWPAITNSLYKFQLFILNMISIPTDFNDQTAKPSMNNFVKMLKNVSFYPNPLKPLLFQYTQQETNKEDNKEFTSEIKRGYVQETGGEKKPTFYVKDVQNKKLNPFSYRGADVKSYVNDNSVIPDKIVTPIERRDVTFNDLIANTYEKIIRRYLYDEFKIEVSGKNITVNGSDNIYVTETINGKIKGMSEFEKKALTSELGRIIDEFVKSDKIWVSNKIGSNWGNKSGGKKHTRRRGKHSKKTLHRTRGGGVWFEWLRRSVNEQYRQLIREYTILSANFGVLTNIYLLRYNRFMLLCSDALKEKIRNASAPTAVSVGTLQTGQLVKENIQELPTATATATVTSTDATGVQTAVEIHNN
jgi:hypothetical protein